MEEFSIRIVICRPTQSLNGRFVYHYSKDSSPLPASGCTNETDGTEITDAVFSGKLEEYETNVERWSLTGCFENGDSTILAKGVGGQEDEDAFEQGCESVLSKYQKGLPRRRLIIRVSQFIQGENI